MYLHCPSPRDSAIAVAGSDAAKNHVERMEAVQGNERKIDALGPIHVHVWASMHLMTSAATKEDADILKKHFDSFTSLARTRTPLRCMFMLLAFLKHRIKER